MEKKGLLVKKGTLIDASALEAQARRPGSEAGARSKTDPDAAWTRKGKKSRFGYKLHIGMAYNLRRADGLCAARGAAIA